MTPPLDRYKKELAETIDFPVQGKKESTYRTSLENYLLSIIQQQNLDVKIFQERFENHDNNWIIPDFACVSSTLYSTIGYIETKDLGFNVDLYVESPQIKKYHKICDNVLLTNYKQFIWISNDFQISADLEHETELNALIKGFLKHSPPKTKNIKQLAIQAAYYSKKLKDALLATLNLEYTRDNQSVIHAIYKEFQHGLVSLNFSDFSDAFAQMTSFGFMIAKLNKPELTITLYNVRTAIPNSFGLIKELLKFVDDELLNLDEKNQMRFYVSQIIGLMNAIDVEKISRQLFVRSTETINLFGEKHTRYTDPFIYFYEDFLAGYDPKLRKARGVYYTPMPIVQLIVKLIDKVLIENFSLTKGIAEPDVTALDFATGTGTFLLEYTTQMLAKYSSELHEKVIRERLLPNLKGFEYLAGAYTIAILKMSQFLRKNYGYTIGSHDKINIKLTNTLEDEPIRYNPLFPHLSEETEDANKIKAGSILVVMGNPPYSIGSTNKSKSINLLMKDYKSGMGEKSMNALSDDYVKFIRFAHHKISAQNQGVVGIITSNSFLDGTVHRQMRQRLLNDFDKLYIINLHGSSIKKEGDKNIFDIRVGVSIIIMVKLPERLDRKIIYYYSSKENGLITRAQKTDFAENQFFKLSSNTIDSAFDWIKYEPSAPYYFFVPMDMGEHEGYSKFWSVKDIFEKYSSGIKTHRDSLVVDIDKSTLQNRIKQFYLKNPAIVKDFGVKDTQAWKIEKAQRGFYKELDTRKVTYRVFDTRYVHYDLNLVERPRYDTMKHFILGENLGLITIRKSRSPNDWKHAFVSSNIITEPTTLSTLDTSLFFPLYVFNVSVGQETQNSIERTPNFTKAFKQFMAEKYPRLSPEGIFGYIYAMLYTPSFRRQYNEFLKVDFPNIPFNADEIDVERISKLGTELVQLHLLKEIPSTNYGVARITTGNVENVFWQGGKLYINKSQYFDFVDENIFGYEIGGYQVLQKYLSERKGRQLSLDQIEYIQNVIRVIARTIEIQSLL